VGTGFTGGEHRSACHRSVWPVAGALRITGRRVGNVRLLKTSSILLFTPITLGSIAGPCTPATDFEEASGAAQATRWDPCELSVNGHVLAMPLVLVNTQLERARNSVGIRRPSASR